MTLSRGTTPNSWRYVLGTGALLIAIASATLALGARSAQAEEYRLSPGSPPTLGSGVSGSWAEISADFGDGQQTYFAQRTTLSNASSAVLDLSGADSVTVADMPPPPLNYNQRRAMKTICFISGMGATVWPIGTAIFGPTAGGCVLLYYYDMI